MNWLDCGDQRSKVKVAVTAQSMSSSLMNCDLIWVKAADAGDKQQQVTKHRGTFCCCWFKTSSLFEHDSTCDIKEEQWSSSYFHVIIKTQSGVFSWSLSCRRRFHETASLLKRWFLFHFPWMCEEPCFNNTLDMGAALWIKRPRLLLVFIRSSEITLFLPWHHFLSWFIFAWDEVARHSPCKSKALIYAPFLLRMEH